MNHRSTTLTALCVMTLAGMTSPTAAQECDSRFGACGTPEVSGGGGGGGGGSILIANTDLGDTYQFADDYDNDGWEDGFDNCIRFYNPAQGDSDGDSVGDACDNCMAIGNSEQFNIDGDEFGDVCDDDADGDAIDDALDNCATIPNPLIDGQTAQADLDGDGRGDACDEDIDGDGMANLEDPCPMSASLDAGDETCFPDIDGDGISELDPLRPDVCPNKFDPEQGDSDGDGLGDACDQDIDNDGFLNHLDNCPMAQNDQLDADRDGFGDGCDPQYCYVVFGDAANCLDPAGTLAIYAPSLLVHVGEQFRLPLFVNRDDLEVEYQWTVLSAPSGSSATVSNARGVVKTTVDHEYVYGEEAVAFFAADEPGVYQIKVSVTTMEPDPITGEIAARSEYLVEVTADGTSGGKACRVTQGGLGAPGFALVALIAAALLSRRRRA